MLRPSKEFLEKTGAVYLAFFAFMYVLSIVLALYIVVYNTTLVGLVAGGGVTVSDFVDLLVIALILNYFYPFFVRFLRERKNK